MDAHRDAGVLNRLKKYSSAHTQAVDGGRATKADSAQPSQLDEDALGSSSKRFGSRLCVLAASIAGVDVATPEQAVSRDASWLSVLKSCRSRGAREMVEGCT
jgi:hypothetical protein